MRRYLVVANQTLGGEELWELIRERVARGDCHFHLVVPATPASQLDPGALEGPDHEEARLLLEHELDDPGTQGAGEGVGRRLARQRMRQQLDAMRELGASVSGEIGVADPVDAVRVVLHRWEFDEVILSTLPGRRSRWLAADLPSKIRRGFRLPVTQVTGATTDTS